MWAKRETGRQSQRYYIGENRQASSWLEHCVSLSLYGHNTTQRLERGAILYLSNSVRMYSRHKSGRVQIPKMVRAGYSTIGTLSLRLAETSGRPISLNVGMNQTRPLLIHVNPKIYIYIYFPFCVSYSYFLLFHSAALNLENLILIFIPRLELLRMMS